MLVVIGSPGSGKTTLLRRIALVLTNSSTHDVPVMLRGKLPIYLAIREHSDAIMRTYNDKAFMLADAIEATLAKYDLTPPEGWFRTQLMKGRCVVLIDGLDEIAEAQTRVKVAEWVEQQMTAYKQNHFILSSRPHGYEGIKIRYVEKIEIRPFTQNDVREFIQKWYHANEVMRSLRDDRGVRINAKQRADDLMQRLPVRLALASLAINPLLVTMIATVHSYKGTLPGRRVDLYSDIFDVFLRRRIEVWQNARSEPAQVLDILKVVAYFMMDEKVREISISDAEKVILPVLQATGTKLAPSEFLRNVDQQSGLLLEVGPGKYSFAHLTFQEYLASSFIIADRTGELQTALIGQIGEGWWDETIRLYAAQTDATSIIAACLQEKPPAPPVLSLAIDCVTEARRIDPTIRADFDQTLEQSMESQDPEQRALGAEAKLSSRLRWMVRESDTFFIDSGLLTNIEYQLFVDEMLARGRFHFPDSWTKPVFPAGEAMLPVSGIRPEDSIAFCEWLTARDLWLSRYRIPTSSECRIVDTTDNIAKRPMGYYVQTANSLAICPSDLAEQELSIKHHHLVNKPETDLDSLWELIEARKQLNAKRPSMDEILARVVPVGGHGGIGGGSDNFGVRGRERWIEEDNLQRFRFQWFYKDDASFARIFDLALDPVLDYLSQRFLETISDRKRFTSWISAQPFHNLQILDAERAFKNLSALLTSRESRQVLASPDLLVNENLLRTLDLLRTRSWVQPTELTEPNKLESAYKFLRWYARVCTCGLAATMFSTRRGDQSSQDFRRQFQSASEELILVLTIIGDRIRGQKSPFEGIRLVKVVGS